MKECPNCGKTYPDSFQFCPADASTLEPSQAVGGTPEELAPRPGAQISVRTLMLSLASLVAIAAISFTGFFLYLYAKPKYGGLVLKTTPPGAVIFVDGKQKGVSPLTLADLRTGSHRISAVKEGYREFLTQVEVMPYATENLHWKLEPVVAQLTNEQLAEVEAWRKKLDSAARENILLPPPDDYNVLLFVNKILGIDPANAYALEAKGRLSDGIRKSADAAYAREDWLEAEKQYKSLALIYPDDIPINERLADISAKIDASMKDRDAQIADWQGKAEAAIKSGALLPPDKDNALDALRNILRLDKKNAYARDTLNRVRDSMQNRGDTKITGGDLPGARSDFRLVLQYFPEDPYSKSRLAVVETKLAELAQADQLKLQRAQEEMQSKQRVSGLRQSALNDFRAGAYERSISQWQEYLKFEPGSDEAFYYIGSSYQEQKQFDTAILNFEKCLSINPNHAQAHVNLGVLYDRHRNDLVRSAEHLKKARDLGGSEKYAADKIQAMLQDLQDRSVLKTLEKTPYAVEHKHTFSSCRGDLRITDEGVEFKTGETDHSFYETYSTIRSFSVDGDEISIRTRNNKKYNFRLINPTDAARVRRLALHHQLTS
jgi:tetratricopeptide (TPR) repeat protein